MVVPYARIDDGLDGHPKAEELSDAALGLWVRGLSYASRYMTDGYLPVAWVRMRVQGKARRREARELVDRGWWHEDGRGGFRIHDYLDYQLSAEQMESARAASRARKRRQRTDVTAGVTP
jgi:hypothetical protein